MAKINSRQKGARGERELAKVLTEYGYPARRGQQFNGLEGDDVVCLPLDKFHIECKLVEALNIQKAIEQSKKDADISQYPVVMHKRNRTEWLCTLPLKDFLEILNTHPTFPKMPLCPSCGTPNTVRFTFIKSKCEECSHVFYTEHN